MNEIQSNISITSEDFCLNTEAYLKLIEHLHDRRRAARVGGTEKARKRHLERGRILPRDRVEALLDPGSPFLEIADLCGDGLYEGVPPGASIITGIGQVSGRNCMIIANDTTVKGGTYFTMTAKKHVRAQKIAWENRLPCITLVDSGGAFLPEQAGIFPDEGQFGSIFFQQIRMSADGIPQIAVVMGPSTAGGAYIPALCDEAIIIRQQGYMFLGGPELTRAATGEVIDREALGGADMHCNISGVTDHIADNDAHALAIVRDVVDRLGDKPQRLRQVREPEPPLHDPREIYGIISRDVKCPTDNRQIVARLVDGSRFQEFKANYGPSLLCGFAHINGYEVGILANNGVLFSECALKAAHFISLCCQRDIPLLFLADVAGFMVGREAEESGIAKHGAKMISAMCAANVPKYTIAIGGSFGAGYLAMCGRAFRPRAMFSWPHGRLAIMGPDQAANTLATVRRSSLELEGKPWTLDEEAEFKKPIHKLYDDFASPYNFARHLWIDNVIDPLETREVMTLLLDIAARVPSEPTKFNVFRF